MPDPAMPDPAIPDRVRHSLIEDVQGIGFGVCLGAVGLMVMTHMGFVTGQTAGLAALIGYATGLPFPLVYFTLSLPFLWIGYRRMGPVFAVKTFIAVSLLTLASAVLPQVLQFGHVEPAFAAVLFGTLCGFSALSVVRHGGSFGGVSIIALIVQDRYRIQAGHVQLAFDAVLFAVATLIIDPVLLAWSVLGAVVFNLFLAVNHRRDRYIAV